MTVSTHQYIQAPHIRHPRVQLSSQCGQARLDILPLCHSGLQVPLRRQSDLYLALAGAASPVCVAAGFARPVLCCHRAQATFRLRWTSETENVTRKVLSEEMWHQIDGDAWIKTRVDGQHLLIITGQGRPDGVMKDMVYKPDTILYRLFLYRPLFTHKNVVTRAAATTLWRNTRMYTALSKADVWVLLLVLSSADPAVILIHDLSLQVLVSFRGQRGEHSGGEGTYWDKQSTR